MAQKIKHVVIKQTNDRWYVCLMLELPVLEIKHAPTGKEVGIDVGLKSLAALSPGELIENPRWLSKSLAKMRRLSRHASRQVKGSRRQRNTYVKIAQLHEHVSCQRADYLHKASRRLVDQNDLIAIEDLVLAFMNRNEHLSLSSHDAGFGLFRQMLEYKAEEAGIQVISVNPYNTTQTCSRCGRIVPKGLSVRVHECPDCGIVLDRDVNAARNILTLALQDPHGRCGQTATWAAAPCVV